MTTGEPARSHETPLGRDILYALRYYLGGRRGLLILAGVTAIGGLALNWSWLVAIGVAPLLIALAPCAIMCAFGLCAVRMAGRSCASEGNTAEPDVPARTVANVPSKTAPWPVRTQRARKARPKASRRSLPPAATAAVPTPAANCGSKPMLSKGGNTNRLPGMARETRAEAARSAVSHAAVTASVPTVEQDGDPASPKAAKVIALDAATETPNERS